MMQLRLGILGLVLGMSAVGCAQKTAPTRVGGTPGIESPVSADPNQRAGELRRAVGSLEETVARMPGRDRSEDRRLAAEAFASASAAVEQLGGPNPPGAFRQQLRIIDNTRAFLRSSRDEISTDPSVDSGLRSLYGALESVRNRLFRDDKEIGAPLSALSTRLADLDSVRGPLHSLVVAQAFGEASRVIDAMADKVEAAQAASKAYSAGPATRP